jgi:hypothetical protein
MAWAVTAPAARLALAALWTGALTGVTVYNGQQVTGDLATEGVIAGYQDPNTQNSMAGVIASEGYGGSPDRDQYQINCAVVVATGEDDYSAYLQRAFDLFAMCGQAVSANSSLNGTVMVARVASWAVSEALGKTATVIMILFTVSIDAYTTV